MDSVGRDRGLALWVTLMIVPNPIDKQSYYDPCQVCLARLGQALECALSNAWNVLIS